MTSFRTGVSLTAFLCVLATGSTALAEEAQPLSFDQGLTFSRSFSATPQESGGHLSEAAAEAQGYKVLKSWSSIADGDIAPARFAAADRGQNAGGGSYSLADAMADAVWRKRVARSLWGD